MNERPRLSLPAPVRQLAAAWTDAQLAMTRSYRNALARVADRGADAPGVQRLLADAAAVGVSYYDALLWLGNRYRSQLTETPQRDPVRPPPQASPSGRVEVTLYGKAGTTVTTTFRLENELDRLTTVSFLVSAFAPDDGGMAFRPTLRFEPERVQLQPGEEQGVALSLDLDDRFVPGTLYRGTAVVRGYDRLELSIVAWAEPPAPSAS